MPANKLTTILFDLDGTLLDTAPDLAFSINQLLKIHNRPLLPFSIIRPQAGRGGKNLITLGFGIEDNHPRFISLWENLLDIYHKHLTRETRLFPGMEEVLNYLVIQNLSWGIVTNKPSWLTDPLLKELGLFDKTVCIVSGDTLVKRKPDPEPLLHACKLLHCKPEETVYIGDAESDIQAGKNAGTHTLIAEYGYISVSDNLKTWGADGILQHPTDVINWLNQRLLFS